VKKANLKYQKIPAGAGPGMYLQLLILAGLTPSKEISSSVASWRSFYIFIEFAGHPVRKFMRCLLPTGTVDHSTRTNGPGTIYVPLD
jgi:hypothetical protein